MKIINILCSVVFGLIIALPIPGAFGVFPPPTPDMYNTQQAYDFIIALMGVKYITAIMSVVCMLTLALMVTGRMALAALLILPISVNVVAFHAVLDGGLFTAGASLGNLMLILNCYFLWKNRNLYLPLFQKQKNV
jgi:hypothetical protein